MTIEGKYPPSGGVVDTETVMNAIAFASVAETEGRSATDKVVNPAGLIDFQNDYVANIVDTELTGKVITAATHGFTNKNIDVKVFENIDANTVSEIEVGVSINPTTFDVTLSWVTPFNGYVILAGNKSIET